MPSAVALADFVPFAWTLTPFPGRPIAFFDHTHNLPLQLIVELGVPLGLATIAGVVLTGYIGALRDHGLALAAGVTLYVGMSNLVPEFRARGGWRLPLAFVAGSAVYFAARTLAGA